MKTSLSQALLKILNPLVRLMLKYDLTHSEFVEIARHAYVSVAFRYFSLPQRKNTISRVSVITGLSRKEVARISAIKTEVSESHAKSNRAARVIMGWLRDPDFIDDNGLPCELTVRGETHSFEELVKRYSGGIIPRAILDELIRVGAVSKLDKHTVKLNHYAYLPTENSSEMVNVLSKHTADLLNTGIYNITREKHKPARFQRQITSFDLPDELAEQFQTFSQEKLNHLMIELNDWLTTHKRDLPLDRTHHDNRVAVGAYFYKNKMEQESDT